MNIWVIGRAYPQPANRWKGSFEWEQACMLAAHGHTVTYLACVFHPTKKIKHWGFAAWHEEKVQVCCYSQFFAPERLHLPCSSLRRRRWLALLQKAEEMGGLPDIIHIHYPAMLCETEVLEAYRSHGVKIVCTEHWSKVLLSQLRPREAARLQWHAEHAHGMAAVGAPLAHAVQKITASARRVAVIPNVINPVFYPRPKPSDGIFRFITVGRLVSLRQYDRVICAFDEIFHGRQDVTLTLIGGGDQERKLRKLIRARGAQDNILLAGVRSREACAESTAAADCLICYSRYETFGVPVIEAWACGTPVIAPSHLDFLFCENKEKLGYAVNTDDTQDLCRAMQAMVTHANAFDRTYISQYAQKHFSEDAVYQDLLSLYETGNQA